MFDLDTLIAKTNRDFPSDLRPRKPEEPKQQRLMVVALTLLLIALGFALYHDRDFWFPDQQVAEDQTSESTPATSAKSGAAPHKKSRNTKNQSRTSASSNSSAEPDASAPINATATRTVLRPLEVEVVAGNVHRIVHPRSDTVEVDLAPETPLGAAAKARTPDSTTDNAASVTSNASEHVQVSAETAELVSQPVKPSYPLLARQMKVQGSVILQAMISKSGSIQDLHVVSGPPILATAAQEAVKQWHFKPHFQGAEPVEAETRITVNFTISTN